MNRDTLYYQGAGGVTPLEKHHIVGAHWSYAFDQSGYSDLKCPGCGAVYSFFDAYWKTAQHLSHNPDCIGACKAKITMGLLEGHIKPLALTPP